MDERLRLADAARELVPLRQGDLDGLCGVYAIVNAIRLALYPGRTFNADELEHLFDTGLRRLQRARQLRSAITGGMFETVFASVCSEMLDAVWSIADERLQLIPGPPTAYAGNVELIRYIKGAIRDGCPVLLGVQGRYDHWTVAARFTRFNILLFDSSTHHRIAVSSLGVDADEDRGLHVTDGGIAHIRTAPEPAAGISSLVNSRNASP